MEDGKYQNELNISDPEQIKRAVYDVEEATSNAFDIILEHKMINSDTRVPLIRFLQLLVAHHPSKRCRKGSADILTNFDDLWPSDLLLVDTDDAVKTHGKIMLKSFRICGKEVPRGYWYCTVLCLSYFSEINPLMVPAALGTILQIFCRGSKNDTRGFSCGLWVLFHSLSIRIGDEESQVVFTTICDFIQNFFVCEECRQHFYGMCSSVSTPFNKTSEFALWLWDAHNNVNKRLMKEEETMETGDPKFPKIMWPTKQLCPSCYLIPSRNKNGTVSVDWNKDEVFKFLVGYYGKKLVSSYKNNSLVEDDVRKSLADDIVTTTNVVTVPLGAALGIALASCAFGALACLWRSQQKNRKYFHAHSLKNI
ncbi:hypothetical protein GIB67_024958 [Kingdonia uniflora]|uniref:Sulfhydryl oxidase n=1 Tax=Kingdonia uniflora TaxID=39325 RepID=A0A7J7NYS1_9MAGN|nr:hypothetical protein GIB67_024958 [Kingdonia uniflora]